MKRWLGILVIGVVLGMVGMHAGEAFFTDISRSENNELSTGEFEIKVSKDGSYFRDDLKLFDFKDIAPGDSREVTFYIKNYGDIDVSKLKLRFNVKDLEDGSLSSAEALVDNTTDVGELSGNTIIEDFEVAKGNQTYRLNDYIGKSLKEVNGSSISLLKENLKPGEKARVRLSLRLSSSAGNECQTDTAKISMSIYAEQ